MGRAPTLRVFVPASIGNFGVGFDTLGAAVAGEGDEVRVRRDAAAGGVRVVQVTGLAAGIPAGSGNTAALAARAVLRRLGERGGLEIRLRKGLPPGSGLGSSAASAVAGAVAAARAYEAPLLDEDLLAAATEAEAAVSGGWFADNTAASLYGGIVLVLSREPLRVLPLGGMPGLHVALVSPAIRLLTRRARAVLPATVPHADAVWNLARVAQVVAAFARGEPALLAEAIEDRLAEPYRARLVPGFQKAKEAALAAGAMGCGLSGAGPTLFALALDAGRARAAGRAAAAVFRGRGVAARVRVTTIDPRGARGTDWIARKG